MLTINLLHGFDPWKGWDPRLPYPKIARCAWCEHTIYGIGCDEWDLAHGEWFLDGMEDPPKPLFVDDEWYCWEGCRRAHEGDKEARARIYFMQSGESGAIKIGTARDIKARRRELQCGNPTKLILLGSISGGRDVEKALHDLHAEYRIQGEWFMPNENLNNIIAAMADDGDDLEDDDEDAA